MASEAQAGQSFRIAHTTTSAEAQRRWQGFTHSAKTSAGQRSMQASREPPGQSDGVGEGEGDGVGVGLGVGEGPGFTVEPIAPTLMSENLTLAFACLASTSLGTPDVMAQEPLVEPGWEPSVG